MSSQPAASGGGSPGRPDPSSSTDQQASSASPPGKGKEIVQQTGASPPKQDNTLDSTCENATIEADVDAGTGPGPASNDEDEGFVQDAPSTGSTSLSSSVRDYVFEHNRRYHKFKEGRYLIPNDEPEQEREDMKHAMIVNLTDGRLHLAPIKNPHKVLDIGTGTGIWAIDMGDEYPEAEVVGIDLSPIQPSWVPPNVRFLVDDAESEWTNAPNTLDLVHGRHICMAIKDWPRLVRQARDALKPGGWIELQEIQFKTLSDDDTVPVDYGYGRFIEHIKAAFKAFHIDPLSMTRNAELLREGGFENVEEMVWKLPIGTWPRDQRLKTIGLYNRSLLLDALQAIAMAPLSRGLGWTPQQIEVLLIDVRKSLMDPTIHCYLTFHVVYGQKPLSA